MAYNVRNHPGIFSYEHFNRKYPNFFDGHTCENIVDIALQVSCIAMNIFITYNTYGLIFSTFAAGLSLGTYIFRYGITTDPGYKDTDFMLTSHIAFIGFLASLWLSNLIFKFVSLYIGVFFSMVTYENCFSGQGN